MLQLRYDTGPLVLHRKISILQLAGEMIESRVLLVGDGAGK